MAKYLLIVESPNKCSKLKSILGADWEIQASVGHVQDLNKDKNGKFGSLGINEQTLEMDYKLTERGTTVINRLKGLLKNNKFERVVLATDPDREGEAIAEHLRILLNLGENYERCTFHSITPAAVTEAVKNPRKIDKDLVYAQDARRILDRVIGWKGTSAVSRVMGEKTPIGRVQSQAVKLVVQRELERIAFKETKHYSLQAQVDNWKTVLNTEKSNLLDEKGYWSNLEHAKELKDKIKTLTVVSYEQKKVSESAPMPFDTSSLHQKALTQLGFRSKKCDQLAQALFEAGHITYIRTDSTAISDEGFNDLKAYAESKKLPVLNKKRIGKAGAVAQEAHECIRPTHFEFDGEGLSDDEKALYMLIKDRCITSQLAPAVYNAISVEFKSEENTIFNATGRTLAELGWRVYFKENDESEEDDEGSEEGEDDANNPIPPMKNGEVFQVSKCSLLEKKTKRPPRYTEASLGAELERHGIGRPATYTSIFEKIGQTQHGYVKEEGGKKVATYVPSDHAMRMVDKTKNILSIMDIKFTANMETSLDDIANGKLNNKDYLLKFFDLLNEEISKIMENAPKIEYKECLACKQETLRRFKYKEKDGFFWKCTNEKCAKFFMDKNDSPYDPMADFINADGTAKFPCPKCEKPLIRIISKKNGTPWWICSAGKGKCDAIFSEKEGEKAPDFDKKSWGQLVAEAHDQDGKPIHPCPKCHKALVKLVNKNGNPYYRCSSKKDECEYKCGVDKETGEPVKND